MRYVLGLNQYSHDAGACLLSLDGRRSLIIPNERITRVKHDGSDTALAVQQALDAVGASLDDVVAACTNNHHHRVLPFEERLPWSSALGLYPESSLSEYNLLPSLNKHELSHHLAHAWSVLTQAPFDSGLVVVMDGMGETLSAMEEALAHHGGKQTEDGRYMHDLLLDPSPCAFDLTLPSSNGDGRAYREAESVYSFKGDHVQRVFKRWVPHRSPPELYNHGFENLESLGALYSRVSSHIFGDWNACGKVMGLGPWAGEWASEEDIAAIPSLLAGGSLSGVGADALAFDWHAIEALPHPNKGGPLLRHYEPGGHTQGGRQGGGGGGGRGDDDARRRGYYAALSARVQTHLEEEVLGFLKSLRERTGETNLCLVGGVIQNSVLNGRIAREAGFENVFIPAWPGDEGIPAGCAAYAQRILAPQQLGSSPSPPLRPPLPSSSSPTPKWSAYQGRAYSKEELATAIDEFAPWLEEVVLPDEVEEAAAAEEGEERRDPLAEGGAPKASVAPAVIEYAAQALANGEVIAWCHGRAEVGARALGHRSILANPTLPGMHSRVNIIKQREQYRPLAPSVLAEHASKWFEGVPHNNGSPFMQITATVKDDARDKVPAITHVDGSARLQTVEEGDSPLYYALIAAFAALAGVPMVMNTSFNLANMPIVESPADAISCFLDADPDLSILVLYGRIFRRKLFPTDPEDAAYAFPTPQRTFVSRTMASPDGEPLRVEVLVEGIWIELADELELEVLERCSSGGGVGSGGGGGGSSAAEAAAGAEGGSLTVRQLSADLADESEGEVTEVDVVDRLRHLHQLRLISV